MADFFVDKLLHNVKLEKEWYERTKDFIKLNGYKKMLDRFIKASEEVNEEDYKKNTFPKRFFKGDLKITDIADEFGIKPFKKTLRICPFHKDISPSLSLSNEKGVFNCFGCGVKGNIITFHSMLKKLKKNESN